MSQSQVNQLQQVLDKGFAYLKFPETIEREFLLKREAYSVSLLRRNIGFIFSLHVLLGLGILLLSEEIGYWPLIHGFIGLCIVAGGVLAYMPRFDHWYSVYAGGLALLALSIGYISPVFYASDDLVRIAQAWCILGTIVVYTLIGLRFILTLLVGWGAFFTSLLVTHLLDSLIGIIHFLELIVSANILGMVLAYLFEHNTRKVYLQSQLLLAEKRIIQQLADRLEKVSIEDSLTGLYNRRHFDVSYQNEWNRAQREQLPLSVLLIDIDYFKAYNDHYGHQKGDRCIQAIANIIESQAQRAGDLVARYGGEEFVIVHPNAYYEDVLIVAERIHKAVKKAAIAHGASKVSDHVTISIGGGCCIPNKAINPESLLKQADDNLYQAKALGRDRFIVSQYRK